MPSLPKLAAVFARTQSGREPVREWLRELPRDECRTIGKDIAKLQYQWPLGQPHVAHLRGDIWELRSSLGTRIARILFALGDGELVLLHGFIKKTQSVPQSELRIAQCRWKAWNETGE
jgi:phage-related protein